MRSLKNARNILILAAVVLAGCEVQQSYNEGEECYPEGGEYYRCDITEYCDRSGEIPTCTMTGEPCPGSKSGYENGYGYCLPGYVCVGGSCEPTAEQGMVACSKETQAEVCGRNAECIEGSCKCGDIGCGGSENTCCLSDDGTAAGCFNLNIDVEHCGDCNTACPAGQMCVDGACKCAEGTDFCEGLCVDLVTNPDHCGACNNKCRADQVCKNSECICMDEFTACGDACVNLESNNSHCGECGHACPNELFCSSGKCGCTGDLTACNDKCVETKNDKLNCGGCNIDCKDIQTCENGVCTCPFEQVLCNNKCYDVTTSLEHCGACGNACHDTQTCDNGVCKCAEGQILCGNKCVDPQSDSQYCGAKGACSADASDSSDYKGCSCEGSQLCIFGKCNDDVGTFICSIKFSNDIEFYKYLEYPSLDQCRKAVNDSYACSDTLHALTDIYLRPFQGSGTLTSGNKLALLSVLNSSYKNGHPDYCSSEYKGDLCLHSQHAVFPVSKDMIANLKESNINIANLIAPENEKLFKACNAEDTCKLEGGVASCVVPMTCKNQSACEDTEICASICMLPGRAECTNYSGDCLGSSFCNDGYCYFKNIPNDKEGYPCSEDRCCADGLYCLNGICTSKSPTVAGTYQLKSSIKIPDSYKVSKVESYDLATMTDAAWLDFIQKSVEDPMYYLTAYMYDNYFAKTKYYSLGGVSVELKRDQWLSIATKYLKPIFKDDNKFKALSGYLAELVPSLRSFNFQGELKISGEPQANGNLGNQNYSYTVYEKAGIPMTAINVPWSGRFFSHSDTSCYPSLMISSHNSGLQLSKLWYERYFNYEIPNKISSAKKGLSGYIEDTLFTVIADNFSGSTGQSFCSSLENADLCKKTACGMYTLAMKELTIQPIVYYLFPDILKYIYYTIYGAICECVESFDCDVNPNDGACCDKNSHHRFGLLEQDVTESFKRSTQYKFASPSCDYLYNSTSKKYSFGSPLRTPEDLTSTFSDSEYTTQCRWNITTSETLAIPLNGIFYAEKK